MAVNIFYLDGTPSIKISNKFDTTFLTNTFHLILLVSFSFGDW